MTTREQLKDAIVRLAIDLDVAREQTDHFGRMSNEHWIAMNESHREVELLLTENDTLRATIEQDEAVIHALCDDRLANRVDHSMTSLDLTKAIRKLHALRFEDKPKHAKAKKARGK